MKKPTDRCDKCHHQRQMHCGLKGECHGYNKKWYKYSGICECIQFVELKPMEEEK